MNSLVPEGYQEKRPCPGTARRAVAPSTPSGDGGSLNAGVRGRLTTHHIVYPKTPDLPPQHHDWPHTIFANKNRCLKNEPHRCFIWVNNMNIKYQQMKSKGNQISELENSPKYWKYDQTIASTRNEPPPGRPSGAAELSLSGFGAEPHQFIFLQSQSLPIQNREEPKIISYLPDLCFIAT